MASLIVAAGIFAHTKIKTKKEAKNRAKAQKYHDRYAELEKEHKENEETYLQRRKTQSSIGDDTLSSPIQGERRASSESQRSERVDADNPSKWVEETLRDRDKIRSP